MTNPRDFIPAKYKKDQIGENSSFADDVALVEKNVSNTNNNDSLWSDLAKSPKVPEYKNNVVHRDAIPQPNSLNKQTNVPTISPENIQKKKSGNKLAGLLVVFFLAIGLASSYLLSKQSQDNRQQASEGCEPDDPYCVCAYYDSSGVSCRIDYNKDCVDGFNLVGGHCIPEQCQDRDGNGQYVCGYSGDTDPCTEDSMGGDWCIDQSGVSVSCEELGMIRCQCSAGSSNGYWVIGTGSSCDGLCSEAGIDCSDCNTPDEPDNPPQNPTTTPTPVPTALSCGETGCNTNADCTSGLTCQTVNINGNNQGVCALGSNQLFCAANPTQENCCEAQAMPTCASIDVLDSNNNLMSNNDDDNLRVGDSIRFRCSAVGNQGIAFNYEFRIWAKETDYWTNLTDASGTVSKNISDSYIITTSGDYIAQGRICWESECQPWESVSNAPTEIKENE